MKYFFSIGLLLITIACKAQTQPDTSISWGLSKIPYEHFVLDGKDIYVDSLDGTGRLFIAVLHTIDSLKYRIKVLEDRPILVIRSIPGHPNRMVWMDDPHGEYSIRIKDFDYSFGVQPIRKSQADSTAYNQITH